MVSEHFTTRIERCALNLDVAVPQVPNDLAAERVLAGMEAALESRYWQTGEPAVAFLSVQLMGLEGKQVEVQDGEHDEPRQIVVGTEGDAVPHHVEYPSGKRALLEYHRVREL